MKKQKNNLKEIKNILLDMVYLKPIKIYQKYGIGLQTQRIIKEYIVLNNLK